MMNESHTINVLLVDDHPMFRKGVVEAISEDPLLEVVGEVGNAEEALELLEKVKIDVAVLDVDMPGMDGLQLAERLLKRKSSVGVVILTMHKEERIFNAALNLGVSAYILKDEAVGGIVQGIRTAVRGGAYVSTSLSSFVMRRGHKSTQFQKEVQGLASLTKMERTILKLIAQNKSSKEISAELFISYRTVGTHRNNISTKLELTGQHPLLNFALDNKSEILSLPDS